MNTLPFTYNGDSLTVFLGGIPTVIDSTHPNFTAIFELVRAGVTDDQLDELTELLSVKASIEKAVAGAKFGNVTVGQDSVLYNGNPINTYLTQKMLEMISLGFDIAPWAKFMDKLYKNTSKTAVDELFLWLDKAGMPITDNGNFLAYKKVQNDYTSFHKAPGGVAFMNTPGTTVEMPRNEVDDNRDRTCSYGLHFCSWHYLPSYYGNQGKVLLLEIDPADVVSIPSDYDNAKGRAFRYTVVGEIDEALTKSAFVDTTVWSSEDESDDWLVF